MLLGQGKNLSVFSLALASSLSFLIGIAAGLLGVGGGEFRLPILICLLGFPVPAAAAANLIIGTLTVATGLARRLVAGVFDPAALWMILSMSAGSIFGAYFGSGLTGKVSEKRLKQAVGALLVILGLKFIHGALTEEFPYGSVVGHPLDLWLGAALGALIGVACGALGVAGGEFRIPAFVYLFGMDVKGAGTVSLAVSLPTVLAGGMKHGMMGHIDRRVAYACVAMGVPAVVGATIGAALVPGAAEVLLKMLLGIVLLLATVRMGIKH
ncbi:MAG: sulfite exporter TauE/SafE family protein [Candidatus Hadarchaeales archaeon]